MKKKIVFAGLIVLIISVLSMTGCFKSSELPEIPPNPFTTTWHFSEEGRTLSICGNSAGHAACKQSEFQIILDNHASDNSWQRSYRILLINREEIVKEIACEEFNVPAGQEIQQVFTVTFPVDIVKGPVGLCIVIPQHASVVTTLWVGKVGTGNIGPWFDITTSPYFLTEEEK